MTRGEKILSFLRSEAAAGRHATLREIQEALDISSTSVVQYWLDKHEIAGKITRGARGEARSIRVVGQPEPELVAHVYGASGAYGIAELLEIVGSRSGRLVFIPDIEPEPEGE